MSLIKLAFNPLVLLPTIFSTRAAKSGDAFKYISRKTSGPITKNIQRFGLAGLAHAEANIRKGMVQDSTSLRGALLDAQLGQFGRMGIKMIEDVHNVPTGMNKVTKAILSKAITDEGKYNIKNIEDMLNSANRGYKYVDIAKKIPVAHIGTLSGAGIGYMRGDNDHKLRSTIKGATIGGAIGGSLRKSIDFAHKELSLIPAIHKDYFADNYWRSQLEAANSPFYNKIGKHVLADSLTAYPGDRAKRLLQSEKALGYGDRFWKLMNTDIKDLSWKNRQS